MDLPISFIQIRFPCNQNIGVTLSECLSNVLITGESDLDERNGQQIRDSFLKFVFSKKATKNDKIFTVDLTLTK